VSPRTWCVGAIAAAVACALSMPATAQTMEEPDVSKARVLIGPLAMNPTLELTNLGVDTNVFDAASGQEQQDFTLTVTPKSDIWLRIGRTWIIGNVREDIVWFQNYASERSGNNVYTAGWLVPLNIVRFNITGSYMNVHGRPGFEIDERAHRTEVTVNGAAEVRTLARTYIGAKGSRQRVDFDPNNALFLGESLHDQLNRTVTTGAITVRQQLTPLTSIGVDVGREQDRFDFSPLRDADSTSIGAQITFDPLALIKGSARVGYRDFEPKTPGVPSFKGTVVAVGLSYSLLGTTRFGVDVTRDVQYSFDVDQPYYLQTGILGSVAQQIYGPVDVVARAGAERMEYRDRAGAIVLDPNRTDRVRSYGGGVGYHIGSDLRVGVNLDRQQRLSDVTSRRYDGLRFGASVTYGF
jgi:putative beta-barrel porin BBP2